MTQEEVEQWLASKTEWAANTVEPDYHRWLDLGISTVTRVLGRPPRSYTDWLADHIDAFR